MARATISNDVLSRVRREQRQHGKDTSFSGLRIVLVATGITVAILLFAFGAVGMLLMARSPQEPIASRLDPSAPLVQQTETPLAAPQAEPEIPTSVHAKKLEPEQKSIEADHKSVKTLRVIAPPEPNDAVAQRKEVPVSEPETTATIPPAAAAQPQVPRPVAQQQPRYQQQVRRPAAKNEQQTDNPLLQLFGIKQYR